MNRVVKCDVCPRGCELTEGQMGACRARGNRNGRIIPLFYGQISGIALDPIEKKPLARFRPGSRILSVGGYGCNLFCPFCQNHEISQPDGISARYSETKERGDGGYSGGGARMPDARAITPEELCELALELAGRNDNIGVAYTYNEPLVAWEFVRDAARLVRQAGLVNVLVTNGCFEARVLREILQYVDAANIDLKAFTEEGYKRLGGHLETVKEAIARAARICHVEVTSLIVPGLNDDPSEMEREASWLSSIDPELTLHITRFFPRYRMTGERPTELACMERLRDVARGYLPHVLLGNV